MRLKDEDHYILSNEPEDLPTYTHETMIANNIFASSRLVAIIDENKDHIPYLNKWLTKEIDIESRYWLHDGQLGGHCRIYDGKDSPVFEYIFKLTLEQAELIAYTYLNPIGFCNITGLLYLICNSLSIQDLKDLIACKKKVDSMPNPPKLWKIG